MAIFRWMAGDRANRNLTLFRAENYAKNYGIIFTAYGVGAFFGTIVAGRIRDIFGSYT
nr:hypothetical protein [Chroococcidiopsis cubana]